MSQFIKCICSLITAFVINSNTSVKEVIQNEIINTQESLYENCIKENLKGQGIHININQTK
jgi:hypothetical protein